MIIKPKKLNNSALCPLTIDCTYPIHR